MKIKLLLAFIICATSGFAQKADGIISRAEVERIETTLAADNMEGRKVGTPGIDKAAAFISAEFKAAGLDDFPGTERYLQKFNLVQPKLISAVASFDKQAVDDKSIIIVTSMPELKVNESSGFEKTYIKAGLNLFSEAQKLIRARKDYLVLVDTSYTRVFARLSNFKRGLFESAGSVIFVLTSASPAKYTIDAQHEITKLPLNNIAGVLPGKNRKDEYVIFSAHYDHLGTAEPVNGDSLYNGANDDAAGTTAVIMLAKYFKALKNNERTLIFVAFTAEEIGGFGSQYFSQQLVSNKVAAMFNIEMIGTESKWGKGSAYITGYEKTDMGKILEKNLGGSAFKFYPDPYIEQNLFYRSDNASLARLGVPAHTISTSKMDVESNYHKPSDDVSTLDLNNMTEIIRAIAISSESIIAGSDTPTRVNTADLR